MSQLQAIFDNPIGVIISFFAVVYAIKEFDGLIKWFKEKLKGYHEEEKEGESLEERIGAISKTSEEHTETLKELTVAINNINESLDRMAEEHRKSQTITDRATLYHLYETLKDKDSLTIAEYECFHNIGERYLSNGGNGAFKKLIPQIESKHIEED